MTTSDSLSRRHAEWLVPAALLALGFLPLVAGAIRVAQLATSAAITPANTRLFAAPTPFVLHIGSATVYSVLGAFQFSPGLRRRHARWHRIAGWLLIPCGLVVALTALWMTQFYPADRLPGSDPADFDGRALYWIRLLVGVGMTGSLVVATLAIGRRNFVQHGAWMIRAYALGLGAGTQVFTHLPWFLVPDIRGEIARTVMMASAWAINLAVAEWLIRRQSSQRNLGPGSVAARGAQA